jgi:hypothetical protein
MRRFVFLALSTALVISGLSAFADNRPVVLGNDLNPPPVVADNQAAPVSSTSVYTENRPVVLGNNLYPLPVITDNQAAPAPSWLGIPISQLMQQFGNPSFKSVAPNGDTVYDFYQLGPRVGSRTRTSMLEFDVASNGTVVSEKSWTLGV